MAYWDLNLLANDADFSQRVTACAAEEGVDDPQTWAAENRWQVAAQGDLADKYASAVAADVPDPGRDPSVISDGDILAAVTAVRGG